MVQLHEVRRVATPLEKTFAYTADFSNIENWDPGVASSQARGDGAIGVGTEFDLMVRFGARTLPMTYVITVYEPSTRVVLEGTGKPLTAIDDISFRATEGGTEIDYRADLRFRGAMRLIAPFIGGTLRSVGKKALDGLADTLGRLE